jgi:hypothetical protein
MSGLKVMLVSTRERTSCMTLSQFNVDNILLLSEPIEGRNAMKTLLNDNFTMVDMGVASVILGLQIKFGERKRMLTQQKYTEKILAKFGSNDLKLMISPLLPRTPMNKFDEETDISIENTEYCSCVGSILYLATSTRPDLVLVCSILSRFLQNPAEQHKQMVIKVIRFLSGTLTAKIVFSSKDTIKDEVTVCFSDADLWGPELNKTSLTHQPDCRYISGYCLKVWGSPVIFKSSRQKQVAQSLTQAELLASADCLCDFSFVSDILKEWLPEKEIKKAS